MTGNLSLSKETEQFSFIRTININSHQDRDSSVPNSDLTTQTSSALSTTANSVNNSSLSNYSQINNPISISNYWYSNYNLNTEKNYLSTIIFLPESEVKESLKKNYFNDYLDKILLIFAGGYFCLIFWWIFLSQNALIPLTGFLKQEVTVSQADANFINYMQKSLEIIDRQATETQTTSKTTNNETVYVPVYTPSPNINQNDSLQKNNPTITQSQSNLLPILPPPPPPSHRLLRRTTTETARTVGQLAAINPAISANNINSPQPPLESVTKKTTPVTPSSDNQTTQSTQQKNATTKIATTNIEPNFNSLLVGVMELNQNSAALFKINGVTQRIWLGDKIENTGWVLESVANQKVTISREGKSLTLNVGENF